MPEEIEITVAKVAAMPETNYGRQGKWIDLIREGAADGETRMMGGIPKDKADTIRRQLSHTASTIGKGVRTTLSDKGMDEHGELTIDAAVGTVFLFFQVGEKSNRGRPAASAPQAVNPAPAKAAQPAKKAS